jgi:hypothetical protein
MSEIPEDVMQAAQKAFDDACVQPRQEDSDMIIARAILAERERCTSWHDHCAEQFASIDETYAAWHRASAASLRGTSSP